jgi:hypothetical protein
MVDQTQIEKLVIDGLRTVYDPETAPRRPGKPSGKWAR